ncbi:MAG: hypothetical protein WCX84_05600 [Syntrophales bacterium]
MTGKREVKAMLDLVRFETERIDSRFLEPACGTGKVLTEIRRPGPYRLSRLGLRYGKSRA